MNEVDKILLRQYLRLVGARKGGAGSKLPIEASR